MSRKLIRVLAACLLSGTAVAGIAAPVAAQIAVFDPTNYAQNILQATRALQQVNNQIQSLQHEAQMIQSMATNLKRLDVTTILKLNSDLAAINQLMAQAKGIAFTLSQTEAAFKAQYPSTYSQAMSSQQMAGQAQIRWQSAMDAFQQTLMVQAQISQSLQGDAAMLNTLVAASDGSQGSLQAQQATNQLIALTAKQQMEIATLMAAQYRAETLDAARKAQGEAAARAATKKFIGTGQAYTAQ
jgi:P-type conjugative transfer protein TrbJ